MTRLRWTGIAGLAVTATAVALAGCAQKPPPPPPPPPPVVKVVPPKPMPPNGAAPALVLPPVDATGLRQSVNRNITPAQTVWNLRSAYNVAALNCIGPEYVELVPNYRTFLRNNEKALAGYNRKVDAEFRGKYGAGFLVPREKYMTEVYNHFALPPTMADFCSAVLGVSRDAVTVLPSELESFAARSLPTIEGVFDDFYRRYEAYRTELLAWEAQYAPPPVQVVAAPPPAAPVVVVLPTPASSPAPVEASRPR